jgi:hypothetical protein
MDEAYFPSLSRVADWRRRGHEFGIHPLVDDGFVEGWGENWERFTGVGYGPVSPTTRVHRILWDGWAKSAHLQADYGFRMNLDYYHVGNAFQKKNGEWVYGHFNGSGLPMKFVDENGMILNIYQQLTQLADDHLLNLHWGGSVKLPAAQAVDVSRLLFDRSLQGGYAAIGAIFHTDPFAVGEPWATEESTWMDGTLEYAAEKNIPIWSGEKWLDFVEARHDASVKNIDWNSTQKILTFSIDVQDLHYGKLCILVPFVHSGFSLSGIDINGNMASFALQNIGSVRYALCVLNTQSNQIEVHYK